MNKDMYFKMMGLKKEAAQPIIQRPVANQGTATPPANTSAVATPATRQENVFGLVSKEQPTTGQSKAETPYNNARNMLNTLKQKTDPVASVTNTDSYRSFQQGYDYAKSKLPQYDQKGSFWTNLLNKLYEFFGSKKRFGVLKQEALSKSASISSSMSRDSYDKMMSLYARVHSS